MRGVRVPTKVRPGLQYVPPRFSRLLYAGIRPLLPAYRRIIVGVPKIEIRGEDRLVEAYRQFSLGRQRLMLAYRHPNEDDPPLVASLISIDLPRAARKRAVRLTRPTFAHFVYGRGVPLWAGPVVGWLLPRVGGASVYGKRFDAASLRVVRELFANGRFPLAIAPEGQVTYHNHRVYDLQPGVARMALWCAEDLERAGRSEDVVILPLSQSYEYADLSMDRFHRLLRCLERECGLAADTHTDERGLRMRILRTWSRLLYRCEDMNARFHGLSLDGLGRHDSGDPEAIQTRIDRLTEHIVRNAERALGLKGTGSLIDRLILARETSWEWIYRRDIANRRTLSVLERDQADQKALEGFLISRTIEPADLLYYQRPAYLANPSDRNRLMESVLSLGDFVGRMRGRTIADRPRSPYARVVFSVGTPLLVGDYARGTPRREAANAIIGALSGQYRELQGTPLPD